MQDEIQKRDLKSMTSAHGPQNKYTDRAFKVTI